MSTALTLYGTTVASTTLSTADKLSTSTGGTSTTKTTTASDVAGTNQFYMEVFSQGGTAGDSSSITAPTGKGWLFDVTTLENQTIAAGNWSAVLKMSDTAGFTAVTMIIRGYVYNGTSYTAINTMQVTGQGMTSTLTTYNIANTAWAAQAFNTGEKLYIDCWIKPTTGHWSGDPIANASASTSAGVTGQFQINTPGYDPTAVTNTWTANDVALSPSDSIAFSLSTNWSIADVALSPSDSIAFILTRLANLTDNATGVTELFSSVGTLAPTETLTESEILLATDNVSNIVVSLSSFDILSYVDIFLIFFFLLDVPPPALSDIIVPTDNPVLVDTVVSSDRITDVVTVSLSDDTVTTSDSLVAFTQYVDIVVVTESISVTLSRTFADIVLTLSDSVSDTPVFVPVDSVTTSDIFARSQASVGIFFESLSVDDSFSSFTLSNNLTDVPLTVIDAAINPTMFALEQLVQTESVLFTDINTLSDIPLSVTDDSAANPDTLSVTLSDSALSVTDSVTGVSQLITGYATTTYDFDNWTRTTSAGVMGTADSGSAWTFRDNTNNTFNATGTFLQIKASTGTGSFDNYLGTTSKADVDLTVSFKFTALDGTLAKIFGRATATTAHVSAGFQNSTTFVCGTDANSTSVGTKTITLTANVKYFVRLVLQGSFVGAKYWAEGTAEPAAWTIQGTQTTYTGAGLSGFYLNAAGTTNYCQVDDYAIRDYRLADSTGVPVPPDVMSIADNVTLPSDSVTTSDTVTAQSTTIATLSDTVLTTANTLSDSLALSQTDSGTTSDSLNYLSFAPAMVSVDVLSVSDNSSTFTIARTIPSDSVTTSDTLAPTNSPTLSDTVTASDSMSNPMSLSLSDTTLPSDTSVGIFSRAFLLSDNGSEFILSDSISSYVSSYSYIELSSVTETPAYVSSVSLEDDLVLPSDSLFAAVPAPLPDIALSSSDSIAVSLVQIDVALVSVTETSAVVLIKILSDQVTASETRLTTEQINDSSQLSITDTLINGVPSTFAADTLLVVDSIVHGGLFPFIDQLDPPVEFFGIITNFTDINTVDDSLTITQSNALLDARSVLYTNTIGDSPSAYYQLNENSFGGIYQKDGNTQPNNSSNPSLIGATLEYTWAQLEPIEGDRLFSKIDADILPWKNQAKKVIIRVYPSGAALYNDSHNEFTSVQATPQWVFDAGAPKVTSPIDGTSYPVYWDATFTQKFTSCIKALGLYLDTNPNVSGIVVALGVRGTTSLEASGDTPSNTMLLWNPVGYTPDQWVASIGWAIETYQLAFVHTPLILSVNSAFISPTASYNMDTMIGIAVTQGCWLMDENMYIGEAHNNPAWNIVPLITVPAHSALNGPDALSNDLALSIDYQSDYTSVWAEDIVSQNQSTIDTYAALVSQRGLNDSALNNYKMSIIGGVYPTSHILTGDYLNGAQQFDGITGYGLIQNAAQTTTDAWTLKATIYPSILPTQESIIACVGRDGSSGFGGYAIGLSGGSSGGPGASFCAFLPGLGWYDSGYPLPEPNQWYSLACSWNGFTLKFYVNGVQTPNTYTQVAFTPQLDMTIGAIWDGMTRLPNRFFIGSIDEVAIYPFALSAGRIATLAQIEAGLSEGLNGSAGVITVTDQLSVSDGLSVFTLSRSLNDDVLTTSDLITTHNASTNVVGYNVIALDNFNRVVSTGSIGVETDGKTWSRLTGTSTISVDGTRAVITGASTTNIFSVVGTSGAPEEGYLHFSASVTTGTIGITFRTTDVNNFYALRYNGTALQLVKFVAGVATVLNTFTTSITANTGYFLRFKAFGTALQGMIWADGATTPTAWMVATSDTTYTSGGVGMYVLPTASSNVFVDRYYVVDSVFTDFILVSDALLVSVLPAPFIDAGLAPVEINLETVEQTASEAQANSELYAYNTVATGLDFLIFTPFALAAQGVYHPVDQLSCTDTLITPTSTTFPVNTTVIPADSLVATNRPVLVDQIAPSDTFGDTEFANLVDTYGSLQTTITTTIPGYGYQVRAFAPMRIIPNSASVTVTTVVDTTVVDVSTFTEVVRPPDTALSCSDTMVFTGVMLDRTVSVSQDALSDSLVYSPTDNAPVSAVEIITLTVSQTDASLVTSDNLRFVSLFVPAENIVMTESILFVLSQTYSFVNVSPSDTIQDNVMTVLVDVTGLSDTIQDSVSLSLSDAFVPSDSVRTTDIFVGQDTSTLTADVISLTSIWTLSDTVTSADNFVWTGIWALSDNVSVSDALSLTELDTPLADTPLIIESIFVVTSETVSDVVLSSSEIGTPTLIQTVIDTLSSVNTMALAIAIAQVDTLSFAESQIDLIYEMQSESVTTSDALSYTEIFVPVDVLPNVNTLTFALSYAQTDNAVSSDTLVPTLEQTVTDILSAPVESLAKGGTYLFTELTNIVDSAAYIEAKTFPSDSVTALDTLTSSSAGTFTGWLDLLTNTELILFTTNMAPVETNNEVEALIVSDSETVQESVSVSSDSFALVITKSNADTAVQAEVYITACTENDSHQLTQSESTLIVVSATAVSPLTSTESISETTILSYTDSSVFNDVSTLTSNNLSVDMLSLTEARTYTVIPVPVETLFETELILLGLSEKAPVDTVSVTDGSLTVGYKLPADTLSIVEIGLFNRVTYIVTHAIVLSGEAEAIVARGTANAIVKTGNVNAILP